MKLTKQVTSIEDLPTEMICELFSYLPPMDLVACSRVNKRWRSIYAGLKLHRLDASDSDRRLNEWYDTTQSIRHTERCSLSMFDSLVYKPLLSNLTYLALHHYQSEFDFNQLNCFPQLVHLEMRSETLFCRKKTKRYLNLPNLQVLAFHISDTDWTLSIDCPKLRTLFYRVENEDEEDEWLLEVKHPETIQKLEADVVDLNVLPFKCVECLVTRKAEVFSPTTLPSLPRLRELRYKKTIERVFEEEYRRGFVTFDRMKRTLSEFLDKAERLRGSDFRLRFAGLQLTKATLDQIDFGAFVNEETGRENVFNDRVYMKNYHLIEPGALHFIDRVHYNYLLYHVNGEFPHCFSQKFTGIKSVEATVVQDVDHFLWFLRSLRSLRRLKLTLTELGQEFYDQLPASAHSLAELFLGHCHCKDGLQLNFNFIAKFKCLSELGIHQELSLESLTSLVRWIGKLKSCYFDVSGKRNCFWIRKKVDSTKWEISNASASFPRLSIFDRQLSIFETENPNELLNFFNRPFRTGRRVIHLIPNPIS